MLNTIPKNPLLGQLYKERTDSTVAYMWNGFAWTPIKSPMVIRTGSMDNTTGSMGLHKKVVLDISKETPVGVLDGYNFIYRLEYAPVTGSEHIYLNGLLQKRGINEDYTIVSNNIYFIEPPQSNSTLYCSYSARVYTEVVNEIPIGEVDDINFIFTLFSIPIENTEHVYLNGLLQTKGSAEDYTLTNNILYFKEAPMSGSTIKIDYKANI